MKVISIMEIRYGLVITSYISHRNQPTIHVLSLNVLNSILVQLICDTEGLSQNKEERLNYFSYPLLRSLFRNVVGKIYQVLLTPAHFLNLGDGENTISCQDSYLMDWNRKTY